MNVNKTEFLCFKQEGAMSTLKGKSLKLVTQFTYLGSNISSTESDFNIPIGMVWTVLIGHRSWENKTRILPICFCDSTSVRLHHLDSNENHEEKTRWGTTRECCVLFWVNPRSSSSQNCMIYHLDLRLTRSMFLTDTSGRKINKMITGNKDCVGVSGD